MFKIIQENIETNNFNNKVGKIVCYPAVWFGETANINTRDLCPLDWTKIYV